jgi:tRNA threonylcarbamoyladenosine biosynthesis protein TsaB
MKARIIAIDTTAEHGSLALIEDGRIIENAALVSSEGFGHVLFPELVALLVRHGLDAKEVDCFAAAAGPGSFTGIRVGLAAVKGLGMGFGRPVAAVSTLQAVAWFGTAPLRAVFLDAHRSEVYCGLYDGSLTAVGGEKVMALHAWLDSFAEGDIELISPHCYLLPGAPSCARLAGFRVVQTPLALAGAVGMIAASWLSRGTVSHPEDAEANYVRRSDAELLWREP